MSNRFYKHSPSIRGGTEQKLGIRFAKTSILFVLALLLITACGNLTSNAGDQEAMLTPTAGPDAIRTNAGFNASALAANDDGSTGLVSIGFSANFYGNTYNQLYVNNNGNVTFDFPLGTFTPFDLTSTGQVIIAPFFADVDTRGSDIVRFGSDTVNGRPAFGVNWVNVGYYDSRFDKLNSFQLVLIDRSDIAAGDFDIEFNYDQIQWETGEASGGTDGLGGFSARVGYSNGTGDPGTFYELPGSAVNGAFLDSNTSTGLIHNSLNSTQLGQYVFRVRGGTVQPPTPDPDPIPGDEGCSPGYWRNRGVRINSWAATGHARTQLVSSVFNTSSFSSLGSKTLLDALRFKGGATPSGAAGILLRAATAAVLNAAHSAVSYSMSTSAVIANVDAVLQQLPGETSKQWRGRMLMLATQLDNNNNLGCPLGN